MNRNRAPQVDTARDKGDWKLRNDGSKPEMNQKWWLVLSEIGAYQKVAAMFLDGIVYIPYFKTTRFFSAKIGTPFKC